MCMCVCTVHCFKCFLALTHSLIFTIFPSFSCFIPWGEANSSDRMWGCSWVEGRRKTTEIKHGLSESECKKLRCLRTSASKHELRVLLYWRCCQHWTLVILPFDTLCIGPSLSLSLYLHLFMFFFVFRCVYKAFNSHSHLSSFFSRICTWHSAHTYTSTQCVFPSSDHSHFNLASLFAASFSRFFPFTSTEAHTHKHAQTIHFASGSFSFHHSNVLRLLLLLLLLLHCILLNLFFIHLFSFILYGCFFFVFCFAMLCLLNRDFILLDMSVCLSLCVCAFVVFSHHFI